MGILKRAADLGYTFRFIRMMVMDWKDWDAYKHGIIDEKGKRIRGVKLETPMQIASWTPFVRLAANIKRLTSKIPGGSTKLGSFAAALYLIKEKVGFEEKHLKDICEKCEVDILDFLNENNEWFLLDNKQLSPGMYRVNTHKLLNKTCDDLCWPKDQVRIEEESYPVGDVFGVDIYEATHVKTNQKIYITISELTR